jgi:hypothetical protein
MFSESDEEGTGYPEAMRRAREAIAGVHESTAYAEDILNDLYLIRDRLATLQQQTAELAAQIRRGEVTCPPRVRG